MLDDEAVVPLDDIQVDECLNYTKRSMAIIERKMKVLRNKEIHLVKVPWQHWKGSEWTLESKAEIWENYLELFIVADFEDEV